MKPSWETLNKARKALAKWLRKNPEAASREMAVGNVVPEFDQIDLREFNKIAHT